MKLKIKLFSLAMLLFACQAIYPQTTGSKSEIKAFERNNKALLKSLKKQYKAKVEVVQCPNGSFCIEMLVKNGGVNGYLLADEAGELLHSDMIDKYKVGDGFFWISQENKWGIVDDKGKMILPVEYNQIWHVKESAEDYYKDVWHPAISETFVAQQSETGATVNSFFSCKENEITFTCEGDMTETFGYFWNICKGGKCGLYTCDGKEIFPQIYSGFYFEKKTGMVNCYTKDTDGLYLWGAKMIKPGVTEAVVPTIFNDVRWSTTNNCYEYRMHRGDRYERYEPNRKYELTYKDKGQKLFDAGKYEDVISFYEGEGFGTVWGNYYMGLSAEKLGSAESAKMDKCINTLKSDTEYYYPIENPDKYTFDAGTITTMYLSAISYLEKYINASEIPNDDPTKLEARKLRGELVTAKNGISKKIDDYGKALSNATQKNIQRQANIAAQEARQKAAAESLANGITNLLFGK